MSVQPRPWPEPDLQVAAVIRAIYRGRREVPLPVLVRDRLGELFPDAVFAEAFGKAGKPGWSPGRLALVTVLQKAANLTDRQAADEVRENLAWKYTLGLGLEDPGFDHSVLSEFRSRAVAHGLEERPQTRHQHRSRPPPRSLPPPPDAAIPAGRTGNGPSNYRFTRAVGSRLHQRRRARRGRGGVF